jgi:hypothetical protein
MQPLDAIHRSSVAAQEAVPDSVRGRVVITDQIY